MQIKEVELGDQSVLVTCDKLPISSVATSGNDGSVPSNVLDNNLNTRWSKLGQGSWPTRSRRDEE